MGPSMAPAAKPSHPLPCFSLRGTHVEPAHPTAFKTLLLLWIHFSGVNSTEVESTALGQGTHREVQLRRGNPLMHLINPGSGMEKRKMQKSCF